MRPGSTRASLRSGSSSSMRFRYLEKSTTTATLQLWPEDAAVGLRDAVENPMLDAHVVMEVLELAQARHSAKRVRRDRGRTVRRKIEPVGVRDGGDLE